MIEASMLALRVAIRNALHSDIDLATRLGSDFVVDEATAERSPPYIAFGDMRSRDWSTASDKGAEHSVVIEVWSRHRGVNDALEVGERIAAILDDAPLAIAGFHLVLMRHQATETARRDKGRLASARLTFRALVQAE